LEIRKVSIDSLNPAAYNPRVDLTPNDFMYQRLKESMTEFGYVEPIVWNETTGNVISGHQRLKILIEQGCKEADVSVLHLDEQQEKLLNIAMNKISGDWDNEKLTALLNDLITEDMKIALTAFEQYEIELLTIPESVFISENTSDIVGAYKEPIKRQLKCPKCSHVDNADRFKKV
jgi:ParB-like chromosome segregation protein Spo0J